MAKALGVTNGQTIPFVSCTNQTVAYALEDIVLGAAERGGIDFWYELFGQSPSFASLVLNNI